MVTYKRFIGKERYINNEESRVKKDSKLSCNWRLKGSNEVNSFSGRKTEFEKSNHDSTSTFLKCGLKGLYQRFLTKVSNVGNNHTSQLREPKASVNKYS